MLTTFQHLLSLQLVLEDMNGGKGQLLVNTFILIHNPGNILDAPFGLAHLPIFHLSVYFTYLLLDQSL